MMDDIITYGVFVREKNDTERWKCFSAWYSSFDYAKSEAAIALKIPRYIAVRIVERVETFENIWEWER